MLCPNCSNKMAKMEYDHQQVFHCPTCGGSFFEENGINRISVKSAKILASQISNKNSSDQNENWKLKIENSKHCPRDNAPLYSIQNNPAVPQDVQLFECLTCYSTFAMPDDLVHFKNAQNIKINFFKVWGNPLPSLQSVMVLGSFMVMMLAVFTTYWNFNRQQTVTTQAEDIIQNFSITQSEHYLFVYFKTTRPYRSRIVFEDRDKGTTIIKQLQENASDTHSLTTGDVVPTDDIYYSIILTDTTGKETRTGLKKLQVR